MRTSQALLFAGIFAAATAATAANYQSTNYDFKPEGQFSVVDGNIYGWTRSGMMQPGTYSVYNIASGSTTSYGAPSPIVSNNAGDAFGIYNKQGGKFYLGTFHSNSYIYSYNEATSSWSTGVAVPNAYGAAVYNNKLYVSGLNEVWDGGYGQANHIFLPKADSNGHDDMLVRASGNSAHMAFDGSGNLYYGVFSPSGSNSIYRWTAAQLAGVVDDLSVPNAVDRFLTLDDGEVIVTFDGGASGIAVDEAGNVFFSANPNYLEGYIAVVTSPTSYDIIMDEISWAGPLVAVGDFFNGGMLYTSDYYDGVIGISVPEPALFAALLGLAAGLLVIRRRRAASRG